MLESMNLTINNTDEVSGLGLKTQNSLKTKKEPNKT